MGTVTTYFAGENDQFLSAVEQSRGGLRRLVAELAPAAAATDRFNKQQELLDGALKRGRITLDQHSTLVQRLTERYKAQFAGQNAVTGSSGQLRAGMQQLSFQLGDVATQFASGTKPMIIFAQQGGQVIQALQLMTNSTKGFLGFLAGPWGQIITAAVVAASAFGGALFGASDAAKTLEKSSKALSDEIDDLGTFFDKTTGKLKNLTQATIQLAVVQARLRQREQLESAKLADADANKALSDSQRNKVSSTGVYMPGAMGGTQQIRAGSAELANLFKNGPQDPSIDRRLAEIASGSGPNAANAKRILEARALVDRSNAKIAEDAAFINDLQRGYTTNADFLNDPKKGKKGPKDKSAENLERFNQKIEGLRREQLGLMSGITADIREQADYEHQQIEIQKEQALREVSQDKTINEAQKEKARALIERNAMIEHTQVNWKLDDQLVEQGIALKRAENDSIVSSLRGQLQFARTQEERRRIQLAILDREIELEREAQRAVMAKHKSTDVEYQIAEKRIAQLDQDQAFATRAINRDTMGPMEAYLDRLPKSAAELKEAYGEITVNALNRSLDLASQNVLKLKGFAGDLFNQLISDVIRLNLQQALTGGGGGILGSIGKFLGMARTATGGLQGGIDAGNSLPKLARGGIIGGLPGIDRNVLSINGIPRAMVSANENIHVTPANDRSAPQPIHLFITGEENSMLVPRVTGIAGNAAVQTFAEGSRASYRRGRQRLA